MDEGYEWIFLQRRYTFSQYSHEKMLNIISNQGNASRNQIRYHLIPTKILSKDRSNKC